jgi:hypothetical protein
VGKALRIVVKPSSSIVRAFSRASSAFSALERLEEVLGHGAIHGDHEMGVKVD